MKRIFFLFLNIGVSVLGLWMAFRGIDFDHVWVEFGKVNLTWIVISVGINLLSCWLRAVRWKILMDPVKKIPTPRLFSALMIGFMVNNVLPFRLGEFVRAYVLKKKEEASLSASFATVVVERAVDVMTLLAIFVCLVFIFPFPDWIETSGWIVGVIDLGVLGFLIFLSKKSEWTLSLIKFTIQPVSKKTSDAVQNLARKFITGIGFAKSWRSWLALAVLSGVIWFSYIASFYAAFQGFSALEGLRIFEAAVVMTFSSFAIMIPAAPGYVGTFHEVAKQSLMMVQIDKTSAVGFAVIFHASNYVVQTLVGVCYFFRDQIHFKEALNFREA